MKTKILNILTSTVVLAGAMVNGGCTSETPDVQPGSAASIGDYPVMISLSGLASTRADETERSTDKERTITSIQAFAFYKDGINAHKFYKNFSINLPATPYVFDSTSASGNEDAIAFDMGMKGSFEVYLLTNSSSEDSDALQTHITQYLSGAYRGIDGFLRLSGKILDKDDNLRMITPSPVSVSTIPGYIVRVTASLERLAAAVEVVNHVPGLTVYGIEITNAQDEYSPLGESAPGWQEILTDEEKANIKVSANWTFPSPLAGSNNSTADNRKYLAENDITDAASQLNIKYSASWAPSTSEAAPGTLNFTLQDSKGVPVQIRRNHLYRIHLRKEVGEDVVMPEVEVVDWELGTTLNSSPDKMTRENLNAMLPVSRIAKSLPTEIDFLSGKVTFSRMTTNKNAMTNTPLDLAEIYKNDTQIISKEYEDMSQEGSYAGVKYKLCSSSDLKLLFPIPNTDTDFMNEYVVTIDEGIECKMLAADRSDADGDERISRIKYGYMKSSNSGKETFISLYRIQCVKYEGIGFLSIDIMALDPDNETEQAICTAENAKEKIAALFGNQKTIGFCLPIYELVDGNGIMGFSLFPADALITDGENHDFYNPRMVIGDGGITISSNGSGASDNTKSILLMKTSWDTVSPR